MTVQEVSQRLGISVQAVRAHCRKADGSLNAKLVKTGQKNIRTWVISGGSLLVDPADALKTDVAGEEFTETEPGVSCDPESIDDTPDSPDPSEEDEDKWRKIFESRRGFSSEDPLPRREQSEQATPFLTSEKLLKLIKGKMPSAMFERNEFLIEIWCEIAPPYLDLDFEKMGKLALYGIPGGILVSEVYYAKAEKMKKKQAEAEDAS